MGRAGVVDVIASILNSLNVSMSCGLPSSNTWKSACFRVSTGTPFLSVTMTSTRTRLMFARNVGCVAWSPCACPSGAGAAWPLCPAGFCVAGSCGLGFGDWLAASVVKVSATTAAPSASGLTLESRGAMDVPVRMIPVLWTSGDGFEPANIRTVSIPPLTNLSEDERLLFDSVLEFAEREIAPRVREMDEQAKFPKDLIPKLFDLGVMGIEVPESLGGSGATFFHSVLAVEALARVDASVAVLVDVQNTLVINAVTRWGSDEVKARFLPMLAGGTVGAYALSEAGLGQRRVRAADARV